MASDNGNIGDSSGFPKLSGVFGWRPMTSRQIPVRRPTALSPVSGYGSLYKKDTDGELHSPEMLLNGLVAKFVDGEWLTYGTDGSTVGNGTRSESYRRAPTDSSSREELDAVKSENNFLKLRSEALLDMLTEIVAETHLREEEGKPNSVTVYQTPP